MESLVSDITEQQPAPAPQSPMAAPETGDVPLSLLLDVSVQDKDNTSRYRSRSGYSTVELESYFRAADLSSLPAPHQHDADVIDAVVAESFENLNLNLNSFKQSSPIDHDVSTVSDETSGVTVEHPAGEHPSRTLFVRNISSAVTDEELFSVFSQHGPLRNMYAGCKHRGFVMISYFDLRHARNALRLLQGRPLRRRRLDIHYSLPKDNPTEKDSNQGTLVVFNLDPELTTEELVNVFGSVGEIKEIRETPNKKHHRFVEYFDIRDAEEAIRRLNRTELRGKRIKIEPSRPGGLKKSSSASSTSPNPNINAKGGNLSSVSSSLSSSSSPSPNNNASLHQSMLLPFQGRHEAAAERQRPKSWNATPPKYPQLIPQPPMTSNHANYRNAGAYEWSASQPLTRVDGYNPGRNGNIVHMVGPNGLQSSRRGSTTSASSANSNFTIDIDSVSAGDERRTTLMIRNIPNKYTQRMVIQEIQENFVGTLDFFYLPIDFKNGCNVGYAFVNFATGEDVLAFHAVFHGRRWNMFNSEKICELTFARIQGKSNLVSHFQNSSLMQEDKWFRPLILDQSPTGVEFDSSNPRAQSNPSDPTISQVGALPQSSSDAQLYWGENANTSSSDGASSSQTRRIRAWTNS